MNRNLYRLVFNKKQGMLVAVAETAAAQGKNATGERGVGVQPSFDATKNVAMSYSVLTAAALLAVGALVLQPQHVHAQNLPTGGVVQAGQASIGTPAGTSLVVQQQSNRAVIDWQNFSIGSGYKVQFVQPSSTSVVLNRVVGNQASSLQGQLTANGGVFLSNPNGILFGANAQVDVGHLVATTLGMSNSNFMAGNILLTGDSMASITNAGQISGSSVALVAAQIVNSGSISTPGGTTALAAGQSVDLDFNGDKLLAVRVNVGSEGGKIDHSGVINADAAGRVIMTAAAANALLNTAINVTGRISAKGVSTKGGEVFLDSGAGGTTEIKVGSIDVSSPQGKGGTVTVLGKAVSMVGSSSIDASGNTGGGVVLLGGNYQGGGAERNAQTAHLGANAKITADATSTGDGGKVIVWSDKATMIEGQISAQGGVQAGNGGFVETSGKELLGVSKLVVINTGARGAVGNSGSWLLDPRNITIVSSGGTSLAASGGIIAPGSNSFDLHKDAIENALGTGSVTVTTANG